MFIAPPRCERVRGREAAEPVRSSGPDAIVVHRMTRRMCEDCKTTSPEVQTQYALIAEHGWRVVRTREAGQAEAEWRCPACWSTYKARHTRPPPAHRPSWPAVPGASEDSVEAGRMFDRALQALTTKPPSKPKG
jgi:hypothetical protein